MEQKNKISIIVPVYNVEEYVDECIKSIVSQTYENLEILIVDDGSRDESGEICDRWSERDSRVRVIHQENKGLSAARNTGIDAATGELIGFVDGDDVVFPNMYEELYKNMIRYRAQICCCGVKRGKSFELNNKNDMKTGEKESKYFREVQIFGPREALKELVLEERIQVHVWNKLYDRSVIKDLLFEQGKYHEDEFWSHQVLARAERIVVLEEELYGYRWRENSVMTQSYSLKHLDLLDARVSRLLFLEENAEELTAAARCNLRFECIRACQLVLLNLSGEERKAGIKKTAEIAGKYPLTRDDYRFLPPGRQFWCILSGISFITACYIRNWLHYGP